MTMWTVALQDERVGQVVGMRCLISPGLMRHDKEEPCNWRPSCIAGHVDTSTFGVR